MSRKSTVPRQNGFVQGNVAVNDFVPGDFV